jgi:hypothetical protein
MDHETFMKSLLTVARAFMNRGEGDEFAARVLKFLAFFIAIYGDETSENGGSHPVVVYIFRELLSVNFQLN